MTTTTTSHHLTNISAGSADVVDDAGHLVGALALTERVEAVDIDGGHERWGKRELPLTWRTTRTVQTWAWAIVFEGHRQHWQGTHTSRRAALTELLDALT